MVDTPTFTASAGGGSPQAAYDAETAKLAEETRKQREIMAKRTRRMMDDEEAISVRRANKATADQEEEAKRKERESAKELAIGLGVAAVAVGTFISALNANRELQKEGSKSTGDMRSRMARAGQDMGMTPEAVQQIIRQQESGAALPGGMTREQDVALFEAAAATSRRTSIPTQMDQFNTVRNLNISPSAKLEGAGSIVPMGSPSIQRLKGTGVAPLGAEAIADTATVAADLEAGNAATYGGGLRKRKAEQDVRRLSQEMGDSGFIVELPGIKSMAEMAAEQKYINVERGSEPTILPLGGYGTAEMMKKLVENTSRSTVPSSGQGLVTP